jgi:hypothetical protein
VDLADEETVMTVYTQVFLQLTAQSAANHSNLQGAKNVEDRHSILCRFSNKNVKVYIYIYINVIHKYTLVLLKYIKIITQIKY